MNSKNTMENANYTEINEYILGIQGKHLVFTKHATATNLDTGLILKY